MRKIFLWAVLLTVSISTYAVPAYLYPIKYKQPEGTEITIQLKGDERVHWAETSDGYTLLSNGKDGWEYATTDDKGDLKTSGVLAREAGKRTIKELNLLKKVAKKSRFSTKQINILKSAWNARYQSDNLIGTGQFYKQGQNQTTSDGRRKVFSPNGPKKLLMILIGFKDKAFIKTRAEFDNLMNTQNYNLNGAHGSVKDYFKEISYNNFTITTDVAGPYTADYDMAYYGATGTTEAHDTNAKALMTEAVLKANADVDYSQYDNDGDGSVDGVYIIYAGYGEATSGITDNIWPHASSITTQTLDGKTVSKYSCSNELEYGGTTITTIGVICHEFGHVCGAPDYYDTNSDEQGKFSGTGKWDLMASGVYCGIPSGSSPAHCNPNEKYRAGWLTPIVLTESATITVPDITTTPTVYKYNTTSEGEYFLIENRQKTGFNYDIPGHGLMIYRYSNYEADGTTRNRTHPQGFYPVCASSTTSIPNAAPSSYGDINSSGTPFPGTSGKTSFTDATIPSAKSWLGNNSFKPITNIIEDNATKTISFTFMGGNTCTPPTVQASNLTISNIKENELTLNWTRGNGNKVIVLARRNAAVNTTLLNGTPFNANSNFGAGDLVDPGTYVVYNGTESGMTITDLLKNSTYHFAVFEYNTDEKCYLSPALTGNATTVGISACVPTATTKGSFGITNVTFNTINNNSNYETTAFTYYLDKVTALTPGSTHTLSVSTSSYNGYSVFTKAWIDWNNDYTFQASEEYDLGSNINVGVVTKQIQVPSNANSGYVTMRIRTRYSQVPTACENNNYSEAEDYTLKVIGGCTPPTLQATNFTASNIQSSQATINWTRGNGDKVLVIAKEASSVDSYLIGVSTFTANAQFGSGTQIGSGNYVVYDGTSSNVTVTGLAKGKTYHFAVYEFNSTNCFTAQALVGNVTTIDEVIWTGNTDTDWFKPTNWSTSSLPTATTTVTIPSSPVNKPLINTNGALCRNITIESGATLTMDESTSYTFTVYGNWINNGTFAPGIGTVSFQGTNALQTISGTATTDFNIIEVKKGAISNILEVTSMITFPTAPTTHPLVLKSGTFKLSSASTINFASSQFNIDGILWNNGGTINSTLNSIVAYGQLINSAGTINFLRLYYINNSSMISINGGNVNISGQIRPFAESSITSFSQTGGILNFTVGASSSSAAPFELTSGSSFTMSDGSIVIQKTSTSNTNDYYNLASTYNVTGGTIQIGNGSTPASQTIRINTTVPIYNLVVNSTNAPTAKLLSNLTVTNNATINSGGKLVVSAAKQFTVNGTFTNNTSGNAGFVLESDATGTATYKESLTNNVRGTVNQYLPTVRNWYMGSPVVGATAPAAATCFKYVEANNNGSTWTAVSQGTQLEKMIGYVVKPSTAATTIAFAGTLNSGAQSIAALTSSATAKAGFNLVGNPYPSYLDWTAATKTNLATTIWYRTQNTASSYVFDTYNQTANTGTNNNGTAAVTGKIPPMQAFWVKTNAGTTGTLELNNSMRSHQDNSTNAFRAPAAKNATQQLLRLKVNNGTNSDEAIVLFNPSAKDGLDDFDSPKMINGNSAIPELYSFAENEKLVINGLNNISTNQIVPLGFVTGTGGTGFIIAATEVTSFDSDIKILLKDKLMGVEHELTMGTPYTFDSEATTANNRFSILFRSPSLTTNVDNVTEAFEATVYRNNANQIVVKCNNVLDAVTVYNATGQKLIDMSISGTITVIDQQLEAGVYMVQMHLDGKCLTKKVIIN